MNFDALINQWNQDDPMNQSLTLDHLSSNAIDQGRKLRRTVMIRDAIEIGTGVFLILVFGGLGVFFYSIPDARFLAWPFLTLVVGCLWVVGCFFWSRKKSEHLRSTHDESSIIGSLKAQLAEVELQARMLGSVFWWYLLPLVPGAIWLILATIWKTTEATGVPLGLAAGMAAGPLLLVAFVFGGVIWLNRRAVDKQLNPQIEELKHLIAEWSL